MIKIYISTRPWMKVKVSIINTRGIPITEAVTVSSLISLHWCLRYGWQRTGSEAHTFTVTHTIGVIYFKFFQSKTFKTKNGFSLDTFGSGIDSDWDSLSTPRCLYWVTYSYSWTRFFFEACQLFNLLLISKLLNVSLSLTAHLIQFWVQFSYVQDCTRSSL